MKKRIIFRNNSALAGVIEALLLIALISVILATIQIYYVPEIMKEKETDHMREIVNQFSNLKSSIEIQSMMGVTQSDIPIAYSPISSPITLGNFGLPYFVTSFAAGEVRIIDKDLVNTSNSLIDLDPPSLDFLNGIPLTSIKYKADNAYIEDRTYVLEGGCLILNQRDGDVLRVLPPISVENNTPRIKINYNLPLMVSKPGKNRSGVAVQTSYIRTNYSKHYTYNYDGMNYIHIYSEYLSSWNETLIKDDTGLLWEYYNNGYINVQYDNDVSPTRIEITPAPTYYLDIEFTIIQIEAQIGPGYVG